MTASVAAMPLGEINIRHIALQLTGIRETQTEILAFTRRTEAAVSNLADRVIKLERTDGSVTFVPPPMRPRWWLAFFVALLCASFGAGCAWAFFNWSV